MGWYLGAILMSWWHLGVPDKGPIAQKVPFRRKFGYMSVFPNKRFVMFSKGGWLQ